ncbi:MAG: lysine--tRNA ligase [Candidatus Hadarchaeota archaeon]
MHWVDQAAEKIKDRADSHVVASGTSISGHLHIGHAPDVFIADAVKDSLREQGASAKSLWFTDDLDPLRRVPHPLDEEEYREYLGMPYVNIPSPDGKSANFVDFFRTPFEESLSEFGVNPEVCSGAEIYESGQMTPYIRKSLEKADKIIEILNKFRSNPLDDNWLPYDPICSSCGKIATTRAYDWDDDYVYYVCEGADYVDGCGHEGKADYKRGEGKLTWRVEWPARWKLLGVTCEPFGKDHAVDGGSYDTGELISKEIFNYKPPEPIPYEWISLRGEPMSSSKGRVFTLSQWLDIADPELLRYFIFRSKALKAKDFDPSFPLLELYKEYRQLEEVYFGKEEAREEEKEQLDRIYELSQSNSVPDHFPQRVPFKLAAVLVQISRDIDHALKLLRKKRVLKDPDGWEIELAKDRLNRAGNWVENYAPDSVRIEILERVDEDIKEDLSPEQKKCLKTLADEIVRKDYRPVELHNRVYEVARSNDLKPVKLFHAIYLVLLGQKSGPRVGNFLTALEDDFIAGRFSEAAE